MKDYSTKQVSKKLLEEMIKALQNIRWGSVEIIVQDSEVVQITERNIRKTNGHNNLNLHDTKKTSVDIAKMGAWQG